MITLSVQLIAFSGRKQAGKDTSFNFIEGLCERPTRNFQFAEPLKRMCVDILGLREEQVFGTDNEKNSLVEHLLWENFPQRYWRRKDGSLHHGMVLMYIKPNEYTYGDKISDGWGPTVSEVINILDGHEVEAAVGPMTGREVMQYWGTELFRRQYPDVWADALVRMVQKWHNQFHDGVAVITDCRFPNEVLAVQRAGGIVVRLTRSPFKDQHPSETALDPDNFDWGQFDLVLDNCFMTPFMQCKALRPFLINWGIINE